MIDQKIAVCPASDCAALWTQDPATRESRILLLSGSVDHTLLTDPTLRAGVIDLVFHPDGKVLCGLGQDNGKKVVTAWEVTTGEKLVRLDTALGGDLGYLALGKLALSADGNLLVVTGKSEEGGLQFWHLGEWLASLDKSQ
jgi:WD40 repeat protein